MSTRAGAAPERDSSSNHSPLFPRCVSTKPTDPHLYGRLHLVAGRSDRSGMLSYYYKMAIG